MDTGFLVKELQGAHESFKENMQQAQEEFDLLMALVHEINSLSGSSYNPYTTLTHEVCIYGVLAAVASWTD